MNFEIGDVVKLNSGGPAMTVHFAGKKAFSHGGEVDVVVCRWFDGKSHMKETFKPAQLVAVARSADE
ncbi:DUF2158 domain-containing protein [Caballeronia sp. BR00000012568055]|uniref:DUF2158 domain-containing protein n=1 Tax=Caballeronia sp. BR00000012568055 TaxID=2918761 RepID=UPI0023F744E7